MPDTSGKSLEIVTKIVESSAYLNKDISSCPTVTIGFSTLKLRRGKRYLLGDNWRENEHLTRGT